MGRARSVLAVGALAISSRCAPPRTRRSRQWYDATCTFAGDEGYVRARMIESTGAMAWAQPVAVAPR